MDKYFRQYKAEIRTDALNVLFDRLYTDARDQMCDSLKPQWEALDAFIITVRKLKTMHHHEWKVISGLRCEVAWDDVEQLDELMIRTNSKQVANYIWYLAKHGTDFDTINSMNKAHQFR